ncbi:E3 binding domain-containing protein [Halalkalicoccus tibetensis]|uniref:E3 binding domain-containing protein n=1 Tax=Halalkalicoccus tibetensis TaxID=175632 RepID=A0ABD5V886_9EURY
MGYVVKMPKLGLEMEQGTMLEWHLEEGDSVAEDEVIAEIESEKSIGEIEAREDGVLRMTALEEGESVPPGTPIGIVAGADEDIADLQAEFETDEGLDEPGSDETTESADSALEGTPSEGGETAGTSTDAETAESVDIKASPRAERRAEELGVGLADVDGSGPQGAITEDDVEAAAAAEDTGSTGRTTAEQIKASPRAERRAEEIGVDLMTVEGSGPQGAITEADVEAAADDTPSEAIEAAAAEGERAAVRPGQYRTATLVIDGEEADALMETTEFAGQAFDVEPSPLDVLLVAVSATLIDHPAFNATIEDETHHLHTRQDVAVAAESDGELLTPVIDGVEELSFAELVETRHEVVDEAIASGMSDGRATFALGLESEVDDVESLIEAPTAAGLLVNSSRRRAVPAENGVSLERCLSLSLVYDTRVLGDRDAEAFLDALLERIENAPELVLRTYGKRSP